MKGELPEERVRDGWGWSKCHASTGSQVADARKVFGKNHIERRLQ
jgi:hypothetical protein